MRNRRFLALVSVAGAIVAFGVYAVVAEPGAEAAPPPRRDHAQPARSPQSVPSARQPGGQPVSAGPTPSPFATAEGVADGYFAAWRTGDFGTMAHLTWDAPADFAEIHRRFDSDLRIESLTLAPGALGTPAPDSAEVPFTGTREVAGLGPWEFSSTLRLARRGEEWKVSWGPDTLYPSLKDGTTLRLNETQVRRPSTLTREGMPFPRDSKAGDYITGLNGTAAELSLEESPSGKVLLSTPEPPPGRRSTISLPVQAAAARVLDGVGRPAAIVAVDIPTRQVRAVADTLGGRRAFNGLYPPGSTFKTVTAAALLRSGLGADTPVRCPASYTIPNGRTFTDADGTDHGTVSLATAFALSCNTTFVQQATERLRDGRLGAEAAEQFGFREKAGVSTCRIRPATTADELGADAIGQNSVQASPLCMAEVAAAVADGTWRPAITTVEPPGDLPPAVPLGDGVAGGLRRMMSAVVTDGTAARAGLPAGTYGKTGTAEVAGQEDHAWFIGYRGSLAFAVFVQNGGSGAAAAAPVAAMFLKAL